jgi:hypothetical protein
MEDVVEWFAFGINITLYGKRILLMTMLVVVAARSVWRIISIADLLKT